LGAGLDVKYGGSRRPALSSSGRCFRRLLELLLRGCVRVVGVPDPRRCAGVRPRRLKREGEFLATVARPRMRMTPRPSGRMNNH